MEYTYAVVRYKIHTTPIIDAFKEPSECPLCGLQKQTSDRLVSLYLNEAVMEPSYRVEVNKYGFCPTHFNELYTGGNVCGVALQAETRMQSVRADLSRPLNAKAAKKEAARIKESFCSCVICRETADTVARYAETIVLMFCNEPDFARLFRVSKGFCMSHYADLLYFSSKAGSKTEMFLACIKDLQTAALIRLSGELNMFIKQFDHNVKDLPKNMPKDSLPRAIGKLK